jgi:signal transduction histidine kinase
MFFTKRRQRVKQALADAHNRLSDAILESSSLGLFLLDPKDGIQPHASKALAVMFRRPDCVNLSIEKLIAPLVTAKTLSAVRAFMARFLEARGDQGENPLQDVEVRLPNPDGSFDTAHYSFDFTAVDDSPAWLVRVTDITSRVQQQREIEDLRAQLKTQGEVLGSVLHAGGARFAAFLQDTHETMKTINTVLKKPAREADAFRLKLEETLEQVGQVQRDAAALKLFGMEGAAHNLEDALQELRTRGDLSGSDFLPLAVKLDQLFVQFSLLRLMSQPSAPSNAVTHSSTAAPVRRVAAAGSLAGTLTSLTELAAQEQQKDVVLVCSGIELVPPRYQAAIKNVAIQLIRNAVMHGIESRPEREASGKSPHGTLQLEFSVAADQSYVLEFQDDGRGIDPDLVRSTAVARGLLSAEAARGMRDRQALKLIFKSGFTTLDAAPGDASHGTGMSLVRRYVHEAGGRIALASLKGHETRFKVTMPPFEAAAAQEVA